MEGSSLVTGPGRVRPLGDLEAAIMELLWDSGASRLVREVVADLGPQRPLAYTTVMTVMDNLYRKGWLRRRRDGRADGTERALRIGILTGFSRPDAAPV
jgi:predicted transcriptional regulator